ncbi:hypothetical protein H257_07488 [Aphanomyces astaci]|uniref:EF-hand domain-containing protein n=1 Tax=Aphanomyces astaci TaxID=112090 RepID=W4GIJ1_APHAT|nr:hypothetical protein H257_07488 [Aphanomyces astaci]ETV79492.1 hypothetical protein H257_07488 [Aphanomyces astaci]|eukprot:XP_009831333.1 hypothetical protein H257_07488 [Aphanomyces astaci]
MDTPTSMQSILEFYNNKDDDVNLTPEETRKVFQVLGLELTDDQIKLLEDIPLDEFMHSLEAQSVSRPSSAAGDIDELEEKLPPLPHMRQDNTISYNQLHEFLQNCHLDIPQNAILEFLSGCTPAANLLEADSLYVDKEGFHAFLQRHAASAPSPSKSAKNRNKKRKAKAKKRATSNAAGTAVAP